ncbi:hypothetical protein AQ490_05170 [Wenjunlia vitaminophila]|uniref:Thiopeptide-type bacteriocin biosynthesis domain-containing protein n=1 Tax=Wenjunlia vitaminophila TaxID=76728 RepID=A0A0T6LNU0_WENVI|nr:lantibiotic dehydratase C-terminal domain-containing protein [Wenjunlia vitaminophila]KRV47767.1 hypothetical protein AQ490_05170 [Wenjunlia vitaminophila]
MTTQGIVPGEWQAIHIFYAGDPGPLLMQCVDPLVNGLIVDGLVSEYFFVHSWLEGPHLRLRLRPRAGADTRQILRRSRTAVSAFLEDRPALYEIKPELVDFYSTMFEIDYTPEQRKLLLEPDGRARLRPTNTFSFEPYEPEWGRYGGEAGVALAEWHFKHSSDLVIEAARSMDLRRRPAQLTLGAQLMMVMATAFLRDDQRIEEFLLHYQEFWLRTFSLAAPPTQAGYDRGYNTMGPDVRRRFARVRRAFGEDAGRLPGLFHTWAEHCTELRERVVDLAERGKLVFRSWNPGGHLADPPAALELLLTPYLRMTNNRLHLAMRDEPYLAYLLARSLRETVDQEAQAGAAGA